MKKYKVHMSDDTRRQLESIGYRDGDPIPGDLGARLQEVVAEAQRERDEANLETSDLAVGYKPVQPKFVDITSLPPEKQAEMRQYLQEYKEEVARRKAEEAAIDDADQAIPENIRGPSRDVMRDQILAGNAAAAARQGVAESIAIDDRPRSSGLPPAGIEIPEGKKYAGSLGVSNVGQKIERLAQQARELPPAPTPEPTTEPAPTTGVLHTHTNCQRCAWPLDTPFELHPTLDDKQGFLAAVLGLGRFEKEYDLLGGNLTVRFRSLTSKESQIVQQQLGAMVRSGEIMGDAEYWTSLMEYRLALSTSQIAVGGNVVYSSPPFVEWEQKNQPAEGDPVLPTAIPRMLDCLYTSGLTQEPIRRIVGKAHQEFQRLVEMLEEMTNDSDFWKGIGLPG